MAHHYVLYFIRNRTDTKLWAYLRDYPGQGIALVWGPKKHASPFETWFDANDEIDCRDLQSEAVIVGETYV
jgi:hypothetical protein